MEIQNLIDRKIITEFTFSASRSSGPGGQNVNKVSTRIELRFNILKSDVLNPSEKELLVSKLGKRITAGGDLLTVSQSGRSQLKNKEKAVDKMLQIIAGALTSDPERIPTAPTSRSKEKRLEDKQNRGKIKVLRKNVDDATD